MYIFTLLFDTNYTLYNYNRIKSMEYSINIVCMVI